MNLAGRNLQAAPLDWAELMSQKIPQPGLQGSPWASGETGSSSTGERIRCFIWSILEPVEEAEQASEDKEFCRWNSTRTPRRSLAYKWCVTGWGRDYPALICKPCLYQGVLGTSTLSQVHSVHQAAANPPPSCPQGVKCAPNPFPTRPITQRTYSRKNWQRNRQCGKQDVANPTVLILPVSGHWRSRRIIG